MLERHGRLDVLVNNAGQSIRIPHADLKAATPAVWRRMLDVNLISPFVLITEAEPALRKSAEAGRPACDRQHRHPCRRAAQGRVHSLCDRQGGRCITSRACWPWRWARPSASIAWRPAWSRRRWRASWPEATRTLEHPLAMRRPAKPEDIADLVAALVANDYVTGEIVIADGGLNLT